MKPDAKSDFLERLYRQNEFAVKLGLENISRALKMCGLPTHPRSILVAGTNGKGATSSALSALLQAQGITTGLFTSPHLLHFNERIRIQGQPISDELLLQIGPAVLSHFGGGDRSTDDAHSLPELTRALPRDSTPPILTYFELCTLMAALAFSRADVDVAVFEVGLGGRLDATNAIEPELCVITHIGLDHEQYLGDSLGEIAHEKAGILRPGCTAIIGSRTAQEVLRSELEQMGALGLYIDEDFGIEEVSGSEYQFWTRSHTAERITHSVPLPPLAALELPHQRDNLAAALAAANALQPCEPQCIATALEAWRWPGRWSRLPGRNGGHLILDAAHNPDGARVLSGDLQALEPGPCVVVFSALADKDAHAMVAALKAHPRLCEIIIVPIQSPRARRGPEALAELVGLPVSQASASISEGLERAWSRLAEEGGGEGGVVVVTGSIYLLGEVLALLGLTDYANSTYHIDT